MAFSYNIIITCWGRGESFFISRPRRRFSPMSRAGTTWPGPVSIVSHSATIGRLDVNLCIKIPFNVQYCSDSECVLKFILLQHLIRKHLSQMCVLWTSARTNMFVFGTLFPTYVRSTIRKKPYNKFYVSSRPATAQSATNDLFAMHIVQQVEKEMITI